MNELALSDIRANALKLAPYITKTPVLTWNSYTDSQVVFKAELFQKTGTFKLRGALTRVLNLTDEEKSKGIVTGTGGNHGLALAHAAQIAGVHAKIVVPKTMNAFRRKKLETYDVEIIETDHITEVMDKMEDIANKEGRKEVNGFNHPLISLGTGTLGLEFLEQVPDLDAVIVAIGGGGLSSGVAAAAKKINPNIKVYGVEPAEMDTMYQSLKTGSACKLPAGRHSIADSLSAPYAGDYSYQLCAKYIDEVVLISDEDMRHAMKLLCEDMHLICEPACAASTAALLGPLKEKCCNLKTGIILCGSNIDYETFCKHIG